jgi:hypothetical protein
MGVLPPYIGGFLSGNWVPPQVAAALAGTSCVLFDQTLTAPAASIDTGPNYIPPGFVAVEAIFTGAASQATAVTTGSCGIQLNGDTGNNYFYESLLDVNSTYGGGNNGVGGLPGGLSPDGLLRINLPGSTAGAGSVGVGRYLFHNYDGAVFNKCAILSHVLYDPTAAANGRSRHAAAFWANTAPITRMTMLNGSANLVAGSRFTIIGYK